MLNECCLGSACDVVEVETLDAAAASPDFLARDPKSSKVNATTSSFVTPRPEVDQSHGQIAHSLESLLHHRI